MDNSLWEYDYLVKVLVVGDSSVGKSCLLLRFADDSFTDSHMATIGVDFKLKTEQIGDKTVKIQIWDTAGQERFRTITASYYRGANGIMLVYDITNENSFKNVSTWLREIRTHSSEKIPILLVGNKCDMTHKRVVSTQQGKELAEELGLDFYETSAKNALNVNAAFEKIVKSTIATGNFLKNDVSENTTTLSGPNKKNGNNKCACK